MKKKLLLILIVLFTIISCTEEELILDGNPDNSEVVEDNNDTSESDNNGDSDNDGNNDDDNGGNDDGSDDGNNDDNNSGNDDESDDGNNDDNNSGNDDGSSDENNSDNDCNDSNSNEVTISNKILDLVNEHRQSIGKSALQLDCIATELAIEHTEYMIAQNEISHDDFNSRFQELQQRVNARSAGENVAAGYSSAESVMNGWLNSDGHRANIEGNFTHIGIAAIKNSQGRLYYTQIFYR